MPLVKEATRKKVTYRPWNTDPAEARAGVRVRTIPERAYRGGPPTRLPIPRTRERGSNLVSEPIQRATFNTNPIDIRAVRGSGAGGCLEPRKVGGVTMGYQVGATARSRRPWAGYVTVLVVVALLAAGFAIAVSGRSGAASTGPAPRAVGPLHTMN